MPRPVPITLASCLLFALAAPVVAQDQPAPLLTPAEQTSLRGKLVKFLEADEEYVAAEAAKDREKTGKARGKAKEDFDKDWDRFGKKGDLLGSMADLRAVFYNCFTLKKPSYTFGQLRKGVNKEDGVEFSFWVPKSYRPDTPVPTVLVLPGSTAAGAWTKAADYFESLWDRSATSNAGIVHVCHLPDGADLDTAPDYSKDGADAEEGRRIAAVFSGFALTMNELNVDRSRVFLDCGKGNSLFGLRFVTLFPDRFAGVILRDPRNADDLRLGSLLNVPVLLFKTADNGAQVDALAKRLREVNPEGVMVVDAADAYPYKGSTTVVEEWMGKQSRRMSPLKVVIEPNHDRFNRAYWVDIDTATPLLTALPDGKPRLEVTADRAANRIDVKAVGVESFFLNLNDDLVDLSKEFTVVVNGKATIEKRTRSFSRMQEGLLQRRDWDFLFPVVYRGAVPSQTEK